MDTPKSLDLGKSNVDADTDRDTIEQTFAQQNGNTESAGSDSDRLRPLPELEPGQLVSNTYRIISQLGKGGMGFVYLVEHAFLKREFALKTISGGAFSKTIWRRFQKEARATSAFDHPNLIKVHDFGLIADQQPFFVMDLVEGDTLATLIEQQQSIPLESAIEMFKQCCSGLGYAHAQGVVHRDIKPSNVMLTHFFDAQKSQVKIVDFGIAKLTASDLEESMVLTRTGEVFGTPYYMSPEQSIGNALDHRADIYSLGCVFFETLTGLPPFIGDSALAIVMKHQSEKPPTMKEASLGKSISQEIERVVAKMLEKDPTSRYQNLLDVEADLERIKQGKPVLLGGSARGRGSGKGGKNNAGGAKLFQSIALIATAVGLIVGSFVAGRSMAPSYEARADKPLPPPNGAETELLTAAAPVVAPSSLQGGFFSARTRDQPGTRIFHFPEKFSVGRIIWAPADTKIFKFQNDKLVKAPKLDAMGEMLFQNFHPFSLQPSGDVQSQPAILSKFRPDEVLALDFEHQGLNTDNNTIKYACTLPSVETVVLRECKEVTDESIAYLDKLPNLKSLDVAITSITLEGLLKLHRLRRLERLGAKGFDARKLLAALKGSQDLTALNIRFGNLKDSDMPALLTLTKLHHLNISGNVITDEGFKQLSKLPGLISIYSEGDPISADAAIETVTKLHLKRLHISTDHWSQADTARLRKAIPNCQINVESISEPNFAHPDYIEEH